MPQPTPPHAPWPHPGQPLSARHTAAPAGSPRRLRPTALLAPLLAGLLLASSPVAHAGQAAGEAAQPLPSLQQLAPSRLDGQPFDTAALKGKPVVVNFWATWCPPCIREMPDLAALQGELGEAVHFVGVAADAPANVERFVNRHPDIRFPLLPIGYKALALSKQWGNESNGLPFTVVLDAQGRIQWRHSGQVNIDTLRSVLKSADLH